jgi:hypothetical protein
MRGDEPGGSAATAGYVVQGTLIGREIEPVV